jgi:prepilin-type N-terminal cleavage/methylation domain-containing protein/prepilin-type processing-associated H-X9-DG protein
MRASPNRRGFTLIELLVVIAIIAVLIALLLPAVQAAREAARRSQCVNNLKQLALASMNYHDVNGSFPSQIGYPPTPGVAQDTRVSWLVEILPQIEQSATYNAYNFWFVSATDAVYNSPRNTTILYTKINAFLCPSYSGDSFLTTQGDYAGSATITGNVALTNYKGNFGDNFTTTFPQLTTLPSPYPISGSTAGAIYGDPVTAPTPTARGMFWRGTMTVPIAQVTDGTSNTLLAGDSMAVVRNITIAPFTSWADSIQAVAGTAFTLNWKFPPTLTVGTYDTSLGFRSNHSGGANFAFVDGSVHFLKDTINPATYYALSSRNGGEIVGSDAY